MNLFLFLTEIETKMPFNLLPSLLLTLFAVGYTPGPANIYALTCILNYGREKALKAWFGLISGFSVAVFTAAIAAHLAGMALGEYAIWIKYVGVAYIFYLAWKTFKASISEKESVPCSFMNGFLVAVTNAKMIVFDLTIFSSFVLPYSNRFIDLLPVVGLLYFAGPCANMVWMLAGSVLKPFVAQHQKTVDIVMAIALLVSAMMVIIG